MREHEQPIRFLVGSGSMEELQQKLLAEEAEEAARAEDDQQQPASDYEDHHG